MPGFIFVFMSYPRDGKPTVCTGYDPKIQCFSKPCIPRTTRGKCIEFTRNKLQPITLLTDKGKVKIQNTHEMAAL